MEIPDKKPKAIRKKPLIDPKPPGEYAIISGMYTASDVCRLWELSKQQLRLHRRNGLKAKQISDRRVMFRGADMDEYLKSLPDAAFISDTDLVDGQE